MFCSTPATVDAGDPLLALTQGQNYLARVHEAILGIAMATDAAQVLQGLNDAIGHMGADVSAWCTCIEEAHGRGAYRYLLACDPRWCLEYEQNRAFLHDPWLAYGRRHADPILARDIPTANAEQRAVVDLAQAFGFKSTVVVPVPAGNGIRRVGVLYLGSATSSFFESAGYPTFSIVARSLGSELQAWWLRAMRARLIEDWRLTDLELLLLARERQGVGSKKIARELGSPVGTIDCRISRIMARLGVANRKAAAELAAEYGII